MPAWHKVISSFLDSVPALARTLHHQEQELQSLDNALHLSMSNLPVAVTRIKNSLPAHGYAIKDASEEAVEDAKLIEEKVQAFKEHIEDSLKEALRFDHLVKAQLDSPKNTLPPEVFEFSGAVVANLQRAQQLGKHLNTYAQDLEGEAQTQKLKLEASPGLLAILFPRSAKEKLGCSRQPEESLRRQTGKLPPNVDGEMAAHSETSG